MFLRNQWYIAAWTHEIGRALLKRRIAGEPIVFYRTEAGRAVAFEDRCPHRHAPLSMGIIVGDKLECGYHGIQFDPDGICVHIPGAESIPKGACVRSYKLIEKWGWAWIWLGDAERADEDLLPQDFRWAAEPGWQNLGDTLNVKAHYQLLVDNLLDLSHEAFLHTKTIGNRAVADVPCKTSLHRDHVRVTRVMYNCAPPPLFVKARGFTTNIDRHQDITFAPPCYVHIDVKAIPAGTNDLSNALQWHVLNALTPETEGSTHYFWALPRFFSQGDPEMDKMLHGAIIKTFNEDFEMLEAQQELLKDRSLDHRTIATAADAGPTRARGIVQRLMREEEAATTH
jgi:phenylpropionate dioxygenase-like ring-hydroxylating dioxygenase large terminal subunit